MGLSSFTVILGVDAEVSYQKQTKKYTRADLLANP